LAKGTEFPPVARLTEPDQYVGGETPDFLRTYPVYTYSGGEYALGTAAPRYVSSDLVHRWMQSKSDEIDAYIEDVTYY